MKHVTDRLQRYLAGELSAVEAAELEAHLRQCEACAEAERQERELWDLLGGLAAEARQRPSIWPAVAALTTEAGSRDFRRHGLFGGRPAFGWSLAGAALAAGMALSLLAPAGLLESPDELLDLAMQESVDPGTWLSDGTWLSGSDDDHLDLVWLQAGLTDTGDGS